MDVQTLEQPIAQMASGMVQRFLCFLGIASKWA